MEVCKAPPELTKVRQARFDDPTHANMLLVSLCYWFPGNQGRKGVRVAVNQKIQENSAGDDMSGDLSGDLSGDSDYSGSDSRSGNRGAGRAGDTVSTPTRGRGGGFISSRVEGHKDCFTPTRDREKDRGRGRGIGSSEVATTAHRDSKQQSNQQPISPISVGSPSPKQLHGSQRSVYSTLSFTLPPLSLSLSLSPLSLSL